jgi:hypothetical protein
MNSKIDIKSALLGLALGAVITFTLAATTLPGPIGRFQIAGTANHGLVLDYGDRPGLVGIFPSERGKNRPRLFPAETR